jgi:hypothetical protein
VKEIGHDIRGRINRAARWGGRPSVAESGKISNANLALLIGLISAAVFVVSLFKFRPF